MGIFWKKYLKHEVNCFEEITAEPGGDHENTESFDAARYLIRDELWETDGSFDREGKKAKEGTERSVVPVDTRKRQKTGKERKVNQCENLIR